MDICSEIFSYIEDKVETWKCELFYNAGKNYLLRMCNDLLRRLSKAKNTIFCGRIQLFLARLFPLEEKSGLNLMSNFNIENVTMYNMEDKIDAIVTEADEKAPIDYNLYRKFWSLQNYFHRPLLCYEKNAWKIFIDNSDEVLNCFESYKLEDVKVPHRENLESASFFAKYLTSDKLLNLQLSDSNFRRNVLLQFLVLFQYLSSHVRFKLTNHILSEDQAIWVKKTYERVFKILAETPPDGIQFAQIIEHILNREDNWNSWKNDGCLSFIRKRGDSKNKTPLVDRKRKRSIASDLRLNHKMVKLGNHELTKLWNLEPDNSLACKAKKRNLFANFDEFFGEAIEQLDPTAGIEEQYKLIHDPTYAWKSLRLLAAKSPHFFAQHQGNASSNTIKTTPQYLEQIIVRHAKEIACSQVNNVSKMNDADETSVEYGSSVIKKEMDLAEGDSSSTDQEQACFEQMDELISVVGGDWRILAACLELSAEKIQYFEHEDLQTEQIFVEIMRSHKDLLHTVTSEKVRDVMKAHPL